MAKTPVTMKVDGYKDREVLMVTYEFEQATDVEGQMSGIPRGGKIQVRVKAEDGQGYEEHQVHQWLLRQLRGEVGGQDGPLRGDHHHLQADGVRQRQVRERLGVSEK